MKIELIQCVVCDNDISPLTDSCPKCGNPNKWKHPIIEGFFNAPVDAKLPYNYSCSKTRVKGVVKKEMKRWQEILFILITMILGVFKGFVFTVLSALVMCAVLYLYLYLQEDRYFTYDVLEKKWESNDEDTFEEVKKYFVEQSGA